MHIRYFSLSRGNAEAFSHWRDTYETPYDSAMKRDRRPDERSMRRERRSRSFAQEGRDYWRRPREIFVYLFGDFLRVKSIRGTPVLSLEICYARSSRKGIWENSRLGMYRCRRDCWSTVDLSVLFFPGETAGRRHDGSSSQIEIVSLFSVIEKSSLRFLYARVYLRAPHNYNSRSILKTIGVRNLIFYVLLSLKCIYPKRMQKF